MAAQVQAAAEPGLGQLGPVELGQEQELEGAQLEPGGAAQVLALDLVLALVLAQALDLVLDPELGPELDPELDLAPGLVQDLALDLALDPVLDLVQDLALDPALVPEQELWGPRRSSATALPPSQPIAWSPPRCTPLPRQFRLMSRTA